MILKVSALICKECEEAEAFPKDIIELESTLGIPRDQLTEDMEKGRRCIACGSILDEKQVIASSVEKD